jgi:Ca2+-binding RTX toxin-like protein
MDDFTDDISTSGRLSVGTPTRGVIEVPGDKDWFAVNLVAGQTYHFMLLGVGWFGGTLSEGRPSLFDQNGNPLANSSNINPFPDGRAEGGFSYSPGQSGTFFAEVDGFRDVTGSYTMELSQMVPETGEDRDAAYLLQLGQPVGANDIAELGPGTPDIDWFSMTLDAGQSYVIEVDGTRYLFETTRDTAGQIFDPVGNPVGLGASADQGFGTRTFFRVDAETSGTYTFRVTNGDFEEGLYGIALKTVAAVTGTAGNDWLTVPDNHAFVPEAISGGAGEDMISFATRDREGVLVNLDNGLVRATMPGYISLIMEGIEHATGSSFNDTLYGADGAERLRALGGDDKVYGSEGADMLDGGSGRDAVSYLFSDTGISASLLRGKGWSGDAAGDRLSGFEMLVGSYHDDFLWGDHRANRLEGSLGDDTLVGNGGDDYILAGLGTDVIVYSGNRADYTITQDGIRTDVSHNDGGWEGHDIIGHAEVLRFADGDFIL